MSELLYRCIVNPEAGIIRMLNTTAPVKVAVRNRGQIFKIISP
jgi:hypothetical protein